MTPDSVLLVRPRADPADVAANHASRLRRRGVADRVFVATDVASAPRERLAEPLEVVGDDSVAVVPLTVGHTRFTLSTLPDVLAGAEADVTYCEPAGRQPAVARAILDRASEHAAPDESVALALVGSGADATGHHVDAVEAQAERLRADTDYGEVKTCFLHRNPTVECVRYAVGADHIVAVPLFLAPCQPTRTAIPEKLGVGRGGVAYADPPGAHPAVTDAIVAAVDRERAVDASTLDGPGTFEAALASGATPTASDGGKPQ